MKTSQPRRAVLAQRLNTLAIATTLALLALVAAWQLPSAATTLHWVLAALLSVPCWLVLRGLLRYRPGTRAWTTLCAIPYLSIGVMELIANPGARAWASACVLLAFTQFVMLAWLLRVQRSQP